MRCRNWYKFCCLLAIEILLAEHSSAVKPMDPQNTGLQVLQQRKVAARMNRITTLLSEEATLTSSDRKELHNLMNTDTYNSNLFSEAHAQFKTVHNEVFAALGLYSASSSGKNKKNKMNNRENSVENRFVFYLDGFEGESTKVLRLAGYSDAELYSANMFEDTAKQLKDIHRVNTCHGRANDALASVFASVPFHSYYLDGCSGSAQNVVDMVTPIFSDLRLNTPLNTPSNSPVGKQIATAAEIENDGNNENRREKIETQSIERTERTEKIEQIGNNLEITERPQNPLNSFSIGFTLTNAGGKDPRSLIDREQEVTKYINLNGKKYGFRMSHVGDDPESYGLGSSPLKREGDVQTTWVVLER